MVSSPYTDLDRPPLGERALQRALIVPGGFWQRLEIRAETGSTNADAAAAGQAGAAEGLVVVAERQGGRRGRGGGAPGRRPRPAGPAVGVAAAGRADPEFPAAAGCCRRRAGLGSGAAAHLG